MSPYELKIFACSASYELGEEIASILSTKLGQLEITRFADGEIQPCFTESIRGADVFIVQSTYSPAEHILELLLTIDAAKRASAHRVIAVIPYFGYGRQDRKDRPRVSIGAKLIANLLVTAGADRVVTMDLHAGAIQGFFDIPVDSLEASAVFLPYIQSLHLNPLVVVAPDAGAAKRARTYAKALNADLAIIDKSRLRANQVEEMRLIGDVKDAYVLIVDDIVDTAGTLCRAAELLKKEGAIGIYAAITHPILSGNAIEKIEKSPIQALITTNSIPLKKKSSKIQVLSIAPILANVLERIHKFKSVSSLFLVPQKNQEKINS